MKTTVSRILPMVAISLSTYSSYSFADSKEEEMQHSGFLIQGEALIWRAYEDTLEYAIRTTEPKDPVATVGKGSFKMGKPDWGVGFKLGLGYLFNYDNWALFSQWTHFHPNAAKSHVSTDNVSTKPIFELFSNGQNGTSSTYFASSKWNLRYDTLDLKVGRRFSFSHRYDMTPHLGLQTAWIRQGLDVKYKRTALHLAYDLDNDFWGLGLQGGVDTRWRFGSHLSLYGKASGALLWGFFKIKQDGSGNYTGKPNTSPLTHIRNSFHCVQGSVDLGLGLEWGFTFHHDRRECLFNFGWEQVIWFNQNQFISGLQTSSINLNVTHGDLSLSGFVLGIQMKL